MDTIMLKPIVSLCLSDPTSEIFTESLAYIKYRLASRPSRQELRELASDFEVYKRYVSQRSQEDAWVIRKYYIKAVDRQICILESLIHRHDVATN